MRNRIALAALAAAVAVVCPADATLSSTTNTVTYTGNGATTAFTVPFKFQLSAHLVVTVAGVTKTLGSDYSVSGAGNATGTVTFTAAPANAAAVVITRVVPYTQIKSIKNNRTYDPGTVEDMIDQRAMAEQQLQALYTNPPATVLPANVTAKLNGVRFADQFASIQLAITDAGTTGAVLIPSSYAGSDTYTNPNSIPILDLRSTNGSGWHNTVSVKRFGAVGNGIADDTGALNSAAAYIVAHGGVLFFPAGTYNTTTGLDFTHAPATLLSVTGDGAVISITAVSKIAYAVKTAPTGSKSLNRSPVQFSGLTVKCNSKAFSGFLVDTDGAGHSDIVSFSHLYTEACDVGFDLNAMMESWFVDLTGYQDTIGMRVMNHITAGGANADVFGNIRMTECPVGVIFRSKPGALVLHNDVIHGLLVQAATVAGFVAIGTVNFINVHGAHLENVALLNPTGTASVELGTFAASSTVSLTKADIALYSASNINFVGLGSPGAIFGSSQTALEGSGDATQATDPTFENATLGSGTTWSTGFTGMRLAGVALDGQRILVSDHFALALTDFYRSTLISRPEPRGYLQGANYANKITSTQVVSGPTISSTGADAQYGEFDQVTFSVAAGSFNTNSYCYTGGTNVATGQHVYSGFVLQSNQNTNVNLGISGGADISPTNGMNIALVANKPTLIRLVSIPAPSSISWRVCVFPVGTDAPIITFYKGYAAFADDRKIAARLANANVTGNEYLSGRVTYDPPSIAAAANVTTTVTATGALLGDFATCSFSLDLQGIALTGYVSAANTVSCTFTNSTALAIDLASGTLRARAFRQ